MKDAMKPCQHSLTDDIVYKEVVIIGNGPSGMVTSYMLAGNVPYLKELPEDLPIDEMLRARLSNQPPGQSLYEADLLALADGLEGRSHNPIPLLMDNLLRPCADTGIQADSLIEWKFDIEKLIDHIVLGRGPPGGSWHTFPAGVRTLSPGAWLALPPHAAAGHGRLSARAVAKYCRRYVHACHIQKYFRNGVVVTRVSKLPPLGTPCRPTCPLNAAFCVYGFDKALGVSFKYWCKRAVIAAGAADKPNELQPPLPYAATSLAQVERALNTLSAQEYPTSVLVIGSGVSAADAVRLSMHSGHLHTHHVYRSRAEALARLSPHAYPDYCQVYKMMCSGPSNKYPQYSAHPDHVIVDVTVQNHDTDGDDDDDMLTLKKVKLLDVLNNQTKEITVSLIAVLIGSKPDLFFLQTDFTLDCIDKCECSETKKRKIEKEPQCFLKDHWQHLKSVLGQSIKSCKSRYLNYTEINGNTDTKCSEPDCNTCECVVIDKKDCKCDVIPYTNLENKIKCTCENNAYSSGIGFGIDPSKPVDGRANPIAIDKGTHEFLNGPKGMFALGPLTADNFMRFIPGGALAIVAHIHKQKQ